MDKTKAFLIKHRLSVSMAICVLTAVLCFAGLFRLVFYSLPMYHGDYDKAAHSGVCDLVVAEYDRGLFHYKIGFTGQALYDFEKAYASCLDKNGHVASKRAELASKILFMQGICFEDGKRIPEAVDAYQRCLRLDPNNWYAKANLERLQQPPPTSSPPPPPPNSQKNPKKANGSRQAEKGKQGNQQQQGKDSSPSPVPSPSGSPNPDGDKTMKRGI